MPGPRMLDQGDQALPVFGFVRRVSKVCMSLRLMHWNLNFELSTHQARLLLNFGICKLAELQYHLWENH